MLTEEMCADSVPSRISVFASFMSTKNRVRLYVTLHHVLSEATRVRVRAIPVAAFPFTPQILPASTISSDSDHGCPGMGYNRLFRWR